MLYIFEGADGSGKSSLARAVAERLTDMGHSVVLSKEPGGTQFGIGLRPLLLNKDANVSPLAEYFALLADRAQHLEEVVIPALMDGRIVILDRHLLSTLVYQVVRGIDTGVILRDYHDLFFKVLVQLGVLGSDGVWKCQVPMFNFVPRYIVCDAPDEVLEARIKGREGVLDKWDSAALEVKREIRASYRRKEWGSVGLGSSPASVVTLNTDAPFGELVERVAMGICESLPKGDAFSKDGLPVGDGKFCFNLDFSYRMPLDLSVSGEVRS